MKNNMENGRPMITLWCFRLFYTRYGDGCAFYILISFYTHSNQFLPILVNSVSRMVRMSRKESK